MEKKRKLRRKNRQRGRIRQTGRIQIWIKLGGGNVSKITLGTEPNDCQICSGVSQKPSELLSLVPLGDPVSAWQGPIAPNPSMLHVTAREDNLAYSLPHSLFYSYISALMFGAECCIRELILPVKFLLFEYLWWLHQRHWKSNYSSHF